MIVTCKNRIPPHWVLCAILPWASFTFNNAVVGTAFLFSLKKFVDNPAGLTFILSLPGVLAIVISPLASFLSDRIWTRFGRRKPFIVASWTGMLLAMVCMPLMPNFWLLLAVYLLYHLSADLNSPMEPLKQEIIPPPQRGWATGAMTWLSNLATVIFYFVMLGRFDDVSFLAGFRLEGEWLIYWSAALLLFLLLLLIMLGIREVNPESSLRGQRLTLQTIAGGLLDRELWPVYLLVFGNACLNFYAGLGTLSNLLYTDQWGYTKQEMGVNVAIGGVANAFLIALLTVFANRLNRLRAYQTTLCLSLLGNIFYYCYVEFILPDRRPTLVEIIVFGEALSVLSILTGLLYVPLAYDYIRRNRMGTYAAGASIVDRITRLITLNGVGLFVTGYALVFQPPAGEMTRVVLRQEAQKGQLLTLLRSEAGPALPKVVGRNPADLAADVWQANGITANTGNTWEIRRRDPASEDLADEKQKLMADRLALLSEESIHDRATSEQRIGEVENTENSSRGNVRARRITTISQRIDAIDATLKERADTFRQQVLAALATRLVNEGDQILKASIKQALIVEFNIGVHPDTIVIEKTLSDLRRVNPAIIDLRPSNFGDGYSLEASALLEPGADEAKIATGLARTLKQTVAAHAPTLPSAFDQPTGRQVVSTLALELALAEEPVETYVSPVTRAVNGVLSLFGRAPDPLRKFAAIARGLRASGSFHHLLVAPGSTTRTLSVIVALPVPLKTAASQPDETNRRFATLLGEGSVDVPQAAALYGQVEKVAAEQHLTVVHPVLASGYAPMRYDYMSGYLWMFVMGGIGISLTLLFARLEARGTIQKRGVEEALLS